jgi:FixJ family two-component response regulator
MLVQKGEEEFRRRFNLLYPTFTKQLHDIAQNLSRKDELFCMLIALGQDSFQIELLLNIAHRSVIMARYRIRQKMQLDSDSNLDDIIKEMLKQDCNTDPAQSEEHR